jgi:hypothetical protein
MMSFPFIHGFAPDRWKCVTEIMLEKEPGDSRCHCLHILALFESDFNQAKRLVIGRKLMHYLEDFDMLSSMQDESRPGRQCISVVLKNVLSHDYMRLTRKTAALIENDAIGCYDRLVNNLILILLKKLGFPQQCLLAWGNNGIRWFTLSKLFMVSQTYRMDLPVRFLCMVQERVLPVVHCSGYYAIGSLWNPLTLEFPL